MLGIFNMTQVVSTVASSDLAIFLTVGLSTFGAVLIAHLIMDYLHNKHIENLAKQMTDSTTMTVQSILNMITVAITASQGMDITEKVLGKSGSSAEKKAQ